MFRHARVRAALALLLVPAALAAQATPSDDLAAKARVELAAGRQLPPALDRVVTPVIDRIWDGFDRQAAIGQVQFMDQYWRLAGNEGFDKSIDRVKARLVAAGFKELPARPTAPITVPSLWIEPAPTPSLGWDQQVATVAIVRDGQPEQVVLSRQKERPAPAIQSFSPHPGWPPPSPARFARAVRGAPAAGADVEAPGWPPSRLSWRVASACMRCKQAHATRGVST